jgi:UDP-glucose 4-epimerase
MLKIGITGASGFIGQHLIAHLTKDKDLFIRALFRKKACKTSEVNFQSLVGDLNSVETCNRFCDSLDVIIHLAYNGSPLSPIDSFAENTISNISATLNLIESLKKNKKKCKLIYPSSGGAIYSNKNSQMKNIPYKESDFCEPNSFYGSQKKMIESYLQIASDQSWLSAIVLRISNPYGTPLPIQRRQGIIGIAAQCAHNQDSLPIYGNMQNIRDYIHLDDVCSAIEAAIYYDSDFEIFNIGTGIGFSIHDVIRLTEFHMNKKIQLETQKSTCGESQLVEWVIIDPGKANKMLNWSAKITLDTGIKRLCDQFK